MATNKQLSFVVLATDPANTNGYFLMNFVFNEDSGTYDVYVQDVPNSDHQALAANVQAIGVPLSGTGGTSGFNPKNLYFPGAGESNYISVVVPNAAAGNIDMYTCPPGKRAIIGEYNVFNPTGGAITILPQIKQGATYYPFATGQSVGSNARLFGTAGGFGIGYVLEAGEVLAANTSALGLYIRAFVIEIDGTSALKGVFIPNLNNGLNTIYTCPQDKQAYIFHPITGLVTRNSQLTVYNTSGAGRTMTPYIVPEGLAADATTQTSPATAIANNAGAGFIVDAYLGAGDSIVVGTNNGTAGQSVWLAVVELDS